MFTLDYLLLMLCSCSANVENKLSQHVASNLYYHECVLLFFLIRPWPEMEDNMADFGLLLHGLPCMAEILFSLCTIRDEREPLLATSRTDIRELKH